MALNQFVFEGDSFFLGSDSVVTISEFPSHQDTRKQFLPHDDKRILRTCLKCYSFIKCNINYWPGNFVFSLDTGGMSGTGDTFSDKGIKSLSRPPMLMDVLCND